MALIKCGECGKEMSDSAKACPHCGYRKPQQKRKKSTIIIIMVVVLIVIGVILIIALPDSHDRAMDAAERIQESLDKFD